MGTESQLYHLPGFYEPFSSMSHWLGAMVFLVLGGLLLIRGRSNREGLLYIGVYACSLVVLMIMSGLFHMPPRGSPTHRIIERLDHGAIFLLIAGSFTPPHGILFRGWLRWGPLAFIWTAALSGIALKILFFDHVPEWLGFCLYLGLGWFGAVSGFLLWRRYGYVFVQPLILGGLAYSVGGVVEFFQWVTVVPGVIHTHELFHVAVLMGAFWHWLFVWQFATGEPCVRGRPVRSQSLEQESV